MFLPFFNNTDVENISNTIIEKIIHSKNMPINLTPLHNIRSKSLSFVFNRSPVFLLIGSNFSLSDTSNPYIYMVIFIFVGI